MLYIIQRKSDGLYCKGNRSNDGRRRDNWTSNLSEVLPYRSLASVANVFGYRTWYPKGRWNEQPECCKQNHGKTPKQKCEHFQKGVAGREADFKQNYRILQVNLANFIEVEI